MNARLVLRSKVLRYLSRCYSDIPSQSPKSAVSIPEVPGLSSAVVQPASNPVGPGVDPKKTGAYKVPEYFCYDNMSFFEAEIEMAKYRLPQPTALKK